MSSKKLLSLKFLLKPVFTRTVRIFLVALLLAGCREEIIHNVSEYEANRLLSSLLTMSIDAAKEKQPDGSWTITVPNSESFRAIKFVSDSRMVREPLAAIANKSSLVMSRDEQRFAYERSLSREIETTLLSVPGVLEARVHLNIPASDPLLDRRRDDAHGTASVLLLIESQRLVMREEIATLVAGASGVEVKFVSVVVAEEARSGVPKEALSRETSTAELMPPEAVRAPTEGKIVEPIPLFAHETKPNPAEVITDIAIVESTGQPITFGRRLNNFAAEIFTGAFATRFWSAALVSTCLLSLYFFARRRARGTGIPTAKPI